MFTHWGLYSIPAGVYKDQTNLAEWFLEETHMPVSEYEKYAARFNPVKFNATEWVAVARNAGMKYIVITIEAPRWLRPLPLGTDRLVR